MKVKIVRIVLFVTSIVSVIACNHYDEIKASGRESSALERSHNPGEDCGGCHNDNSNGASSNWWYFSGTAYNSNYSPAASGGRIELWTKISANAIATGHLDSISLATGNRLYSVEIDRSGNFYTSKIINFEGGFYSRLVSNSGKDTIMIKPCLSNTSCNSCHGHNFDGTNQPKLTFSN